MYFCKRVILVSNMWLFSFSLAFTSGLFVKALDESALSVYVCFHSNEEEPCLDGKLPSAIPGFGGSSLSPRQWHPVCCHAEGTVNRMYQMYQFVLYLCEIALNECTMIHCMMQTRTNVFVCLSDRYGKEEDGTSSSPIYLWAGNKPAGCETSHEFGWWIWLFRGGKRERKREKI